MVCGSCRARGIGSLLESSTLPLLSSIYKLGYAYRLYYKSCIESTAGQFLVLAQRVSHCLYWQSHLVRPGQVSGLPALLT